MKKATIKPYPDAAIHAKRVILNNQKLVYLIVADRKQKYAASTRSKIVYIGTTKNGGARIAQSVAAKAADVLQLRGVKTLDAFVVACKPRQRVKMWMQLERALILTFKSMYGSVPKFNKAFKNVKPPTDYKYFSTARLKTIIENYS